MNNIEYPKSALDSDENSVHISYLPMAHILERTVVITLIYSNARAGIFSGDIKTLKDDI